MDVKCEESSGNEKVAGDKVPKDENFVETIIVEKVED